MNKQKLFAFLKKLNATPTLNDWEIDNLIDDFVTEEICCNIVDLLHIAIEDQDHFL